MPASTSLPFSPLQQNTSEELFVTLVLSCTSPLTFLNSPCAYHSTEIALVEVRVARYQS